MVAVGECITEARIRGLPVLRAPSVYIYSVEICRGCHRVGCVGKKVWVEGVFLCWTDEYMEVFRNGW